MNKQLKLKSVELIKESPYLEVILTKLRDRKTDQINFRKNLVRFGRYGGYEISKYLPYKDVSVETGLGKGVFAKGKEELDANNLVIITVLRAAIPMVEGLVKIFPKARWGIVSASRGPAPDFEITMNYVKIPKITEKDTVIIVDPMLATGSTLSKVIEKLGNYKMKRLIIFSLISVNEGIKKIEKTLQNINSYKEAIHFTGAIDPVLNEKGYIVPGLGDAGNRGFGEDA